MENSNIYTTRLLIYASILSLLLGSACTSPRISQVNQSAMPSSEAYASGENDKGLPQIDIKAEHAAYEALTEDQLLASTSPDVNTVAAAATRPASNSTILPSSREANEVIAHSQAQVSTKKNRATDQKQIITRSLSLPAKVMLKSIVKKAKKMEKKLDIKQAKKAQDVNNSGYLIAGIILAAAGLVLVIAGNTTLLYVLGAVASLAGLILLLLALL